MSFFGALGAAVLRSLLPENNAYKVVEVKVENYGSAVEIYSFVSLALYKTSEGMYDVLLNLPASATLCKAFRLLRTHNEQEAVSRFFLYKGVIPVVIDVDQDIAIIVEVQRICDLLNDHPTWSAAHVSAHFGYILCLQHPVLSSSGLSIQLQVIIGPDDQYIYEFIQDFNSVEIGM